MDYDALQAKMRRVNWQATRRTVDDGLKRLPTDQLEAIRRLHREGRYEEALRKVETLSEVDRENMDHDSHALVAVALALYGLREDAKAEELLQKAALRTDEMQAKIQTNLANVYNMQGRFDLAMDAARRARELAPHLCATHLMVVAILEGRRVSRDDHDLQEALSEVKHALPQWRAREVAIFKDHILNDVDYSAVRAELLHLVETEEVPVS